MFETIQKIREYCRSDESAEAGSLTKTVKEQLKEVSDMLDGVSFALGLEDKEFEDEV